MIFHNIEQIHYSMNASSYRGQNPRRSALKNSGCDIYTPTTWMQPLPFELNEPQLAQHRACVPVIFYLP